MDENGILWDNAYLSYQPPGVVAHTFNNPLINGNQVSNSRYSNHLHYSSLPSQEQDLMAAQSKHLERTLRQQQLDVKQQLRTLKQQQKLQQEQRQQETAGKGFLPAEDDITIVTDISHEDSEVSELSSQFNDKDLEAINEQLNRLAVQDTSRSTTALSSNPQGQGSRSPASLLLSDYDQGKSRSPHQGKSSHLNRDSRPSSRGTLDSSGNILFMCLHIRLV